MKNSFKNILIISLIFIIAFLLRIFGLNWDQNNHLHPDERFLTMLVTDVKLPTSIKQYFDTSTSPLNPYNYDSYKFFVYGTFPIFFIKFLAIQLHLDDYNNITLLGRVISALFDSVNVVFLYFIAKKFLKSFYKFLPSLFYTVLILPLQLSHFYTVDTFLNFFLLLTFTLFVYRLYPLAFFSFGLALSCKISALYFVPLFFLLLLSQKSLKYCLYFPISLLSFRLFQPYSFSSLLAINSDFVNSLRTLALYSHTDIYYPPGVQWLNRLPLFNSLKNNFFWGLGLFFSLPLIILIIKNISKLKPKFNLVAVISLWTLLFYLYQSVQNIHSLRYFYPIYPFMALVFGFLLFKSKINPKLIFLIFFLNFLSALAFLSIYSRPHSRVQASTWITKNITTDNIISNEYWDDALPLGFSGYQSETLAFFDPDTPEKWEHINQSLEKIDYLIMSSNRLWASIPRVPNKYPLTSKFYEDLFSERLNFTKIKEFNSYPGFSLSFLKSCYYLGQTNYPRILNSWFSVDKNCSYPGLYLRDDTAEEAFTVYDHPKVLIYKKYEID